MLDEVIEVEEKLFLLISSIKTGELEFSYEPDVEKGEWAVCSDQFQTKVLSGEDIYTKDFCIVQMKNWMIFPIWAMLVTEIIHID